VRCGIGRCGVGVGCVSCGCSCSSGCLQWTGWSWTNVCW
jgi:hypothetical protein